MNLGRTTLQHVIELILVTKSGQKIILNLFSILYSLNLELLSALSNAAQDPSSRCV